MSNKNEYTIVKTPHKKEEYTFDQILELQRCMDPELGPHYFLSKYYYIQHAVRGKIPYNPFPYQIGLIDTYHNNRFAIALMGRQMGKCCTKGINITIQNKKGEIYDIPIGEFYEYQSAKKEGRDHDISIWKRKTV